MPRTQLFTVDLSCTHTSVKQVSFTVLFLIIKWPKAFLLCEGNVEERTL